MASTALPIRRIDSTTELDQCCESWQGQSCLALDTEFVRTSTFYPQPGLLQLADQHALYLLDPLTIDDWSSFVALLSSPDKLWIMHSASEDLVLLHSVFALLPQRIFDTQTAAAYAGFGFSLSYQALVKALLDADLPEQETRSDWLRRPLSEAQLQYAAADVVYLPAMHQVLAARLDATPKAAWLTQDMVAMLATAMELENPACWQCLYTGVTNAWRLSDHGLRLLQALCVWREQQARACNRPRYWIARDHELYQLAAHFSAGTADISNRLPALPGLSRQLQRRYGPALAHLLANPPAAVAIDRALLTRPLHRRYRDTLKHWRQIVQTKAEGLHIAPELLARKRWLQDLLKNHQQSGTLCWNASLQGWRQQQLQTEFEQVLDSASSSRIA